MMMNIAHTVNKFNITANRDVKIHTNTVNANSYSLFFVVIDNVTTFVDREYATLQMTAQGNLSDVSAWNINRNMEFSQNYASQTFVFFIKNTTHNQFNKIIYGDGYITNADELANIISLAI